MGRAFSDFRQRAGVDGKEGPVGTTEVVAIAGEWKLGLVFPLRSGALGDAYLYEGALGESGWGAVVVGLVTQVGERSLRGGAGYPGYFVGLGVFVVEESICEGGMERYGVQHQELLVLARYMVRLPVGWSIVLVSPRPLVEWRMGPMR